MFSIRILLIIGLWAMAIDGNASKYHKNLELSGDILQIAIPTAAFSATLALKDFDGSQEFFKGLIASGVTVYALKNMVNERRPNDGKRSFPSGHATMAFFGSGFIHKRYGWRYAIPAYAAACFVGYSRIKIREHWIQDVVCGAAIGLLYSYLLTTSYQDQSSYRFYPAMTSDSIALHCEKHF